MEAGKGPGVQHTHPHACSSGLPQSPSQCFQAWQTPPLPRLGAPRGVEAALLSPSRGCPAYCGAEGPAGPPTWLRVLGHHLHLKAKPCAGKWKSPRLIKSWAVPKLPLLLELGDRWLAAHRTTTGVLAAQLPGQSSGETEPPMGPVHFPVGRFSRGVPSKGRPSSRPPRPGSTTLLLTPPASGGCFGPGCPVGKWAKRRKAKSVKDAGLSGIVSATPLARNFKRSLQRVARWVST